MKTKEIINGIVGEYSYIGPATSCPPANATPDINERIPETRPRNSFGTRSASNDRSAVLLTAQEIPMNVTAKIPKSWPTLVVVEHKINAADARGIKPNSNGFFRPLRSTKYQKG